MCNMKPNSNCWGWLVCNHFSDFILCKSKHQKLIFYLKLKDVILAVNSAHNYCLTVYYVSVILHWRPLSSTMFSTHLRISFLTGGMFSVDQLLLFCNPSIESRRWRCCFEPFESTHLLFNSISHEWVTSHVIDGSTHKSSVERRRVIPGKERQYGTFYYSWVFMFT